MPDRVTYGAITVDNLQTAMRFANRLGKGNVLKTELRGFLREAAEPVQARAQSLAVEKIRNIGPRWSLMRVGVTTAGAYVAERQRGLKGPHPRRRPNLAGLLVDRALEPALQENHDRVVAALERGLDRITSKA